MFLKWNDTIINLDKVQRITSSGELETKFIFARGCGEPVILDVSIDLVIHSLKLNSHLLDLDWIPV